MAYFCNCFILYRCYGWFIEVQQLGYEREDDALMSKLYIADILPTTLNDKATTYVICVVIRCEWYV